MGLLRLLSCPGRDCLVLEQRVVCSVPVPMRNYLPSGVTGTGAAPVGFVGAELDWDERCTHSDQALSRPLDPSMGPTWIQLVTTTRHAPVAPARQRCLLKGRQRAGEQTTVAVWRLGRPLRSPFRAPSANAAAFVSASDSLHTLPELGRGPPESMAPAVQAQNPREQ